MARLSGPAGAALLVAAALGGCALQPEFKTFRLSHGDWRQAELSRRGHLVLADAAAGAAPLTVTRIEVGGLLSAPPDPVRRLALQEARARAAIATLERHGIAAADIGVETRAADGSEGEPLGAPLKKVLIVVRY